MKPARPYWTALLERTGEPLRIDREKGIIFGVRILGPTSVNGRRYTTEAMKTGASVYEGCQVRCNHPGSDGKPQPIESAFGVLRNTRHVPEETCDRGDLHYFSTHGMAPLVLEDVEKRMGVFGLSHNLPADGYEGDVDRDGVLVITKITAVESVDLVLNPATNDNLWEQRAAMKKLKLSAIVESLKLKKEAMAVLKKLYEDGDMAPDAEVEGPTDSTPEDMLKQGFKAACQSVLDGDGDMKTKLAKLKELMTAEEKLLASGEPAPEEEDDSEDVEEEEDDDEDKKKTEGRIRRLERENSAMRLCVTEGVQPTERLIEALAGMKSDEARKEFLAEHAGAKSLPEARQPRSATPKGGQPVTETIKFKDNKERGRFLRGGQLTG